MGIIGDGSMDRYRYHRSILSIDTIGHWLTTDSINPSVEDFFPLIDSIDHRSQNPDQNDDHRSIGSYSTDGIDPSIKNRVPSHFSI
jgi:hypothetical protein